MRRCSRPASPPAAEALDKAVMELTLLGLVSLILTTFSQPLNHICSARPLPPAAAACRCSDLLLLRWRLLLLPTIVPALHMHPPCSGLRALDGGLDAGGLGAGLPLLPAANKRREPLRCERWRRVPGPGGAVPPLCSHCAMRHGCRFDASFCRCAKPPLCPRPCLSAR